MARNQRQNEVKVLNTKTGLVKFVGQKTAQSPTAMKNANLVLFEEAEEIEKPEIEEKQENKEVPNPQKEQKDNRKDLIQQYVEKFGKKPRKNIKTETLKERLAE